MANRHSAHPFLSLAHRDAAPDVLGMRDLQPGRDLLLRSSAFGCFRIFHIEGSAANENPRLVIAIETSPSLRPPAASRAEKFGRTKIKKTAFYLPTCGFFDPDFALCNWRCYVEAITFREVTRSLSRCQSPNIASGLRRMPFADDSVYLRHTSLLPTSDVTREILSRAKF